MKKKIRFLVVGIFVVFIMIGTSVLQSNAAYEISAPDNLVFTCLRKTQYDDFYVTNFISEEVYELMNNVPENQKVTVYLQSDFRVNEGNWQYKESWDTGINGSYYSKIEEVLCIDGVIATFSPFYSQLLGIEDGSLFFNFEENKLEMRARYLIEIVTIGEDTEKVYKTSDWSEIQEIKGLREDLSYNASDVNPTLMLKDCRIFFDETLNESPYISFKIDWTDELKRAVIHASALDDRLTSVCCEKKTNDTDWGEVSTDFLILYTYGDYKMNIPSDLIKSSEDINYRILLSFTSPTDGRTSSFSSISSYIFTYNYSSLVNSKLNEYYTFENGVLIFSGTDKISSHEDASLNPWSQYADSTYEIVLNGVTAIGKNAFADFSKLRTVIIDGETVNVESEAFTGCPDLSLVVSYADVNFADDAITGNIKPIKYFTEVSKTCNVTSVPFKFDELGAVVEGEANFTKNEFMSFVATLYYGFDEDFYTIKFQKLVADDFYIYKYKSLEPFEADTVTEVENADVSIIIEIDENAYMQFSMRDFCEGMVDSGEDAEIKYEIAVVTDEEKGFFEMMQEVFATWLEAIKKLISMVFKIFRR